MIWGAKKRHTVSDRFSRGPCSRYLPDPVDSCRFTFSRLLSASLALCTIPPKQIIRKSQENLEKNLERGERLLVRTGELPLVAMAWGLWRWRG
jgi:hypothetical protein